MTEWFQVLIPIASLITAIVAFFTIYYLRKQITISNETAKATKTAIEVDIFSRIEQNFSLNETLQHVRQVISTKGPVLKNEGPIEYAAFATYLESVNRIMYYVNKGVLPVGDAVAAFGTAAFEMESNPYVMKFIEKQREKHGDQILNGISQLSKLAIEKNPKLTK